MNPTKKQLQKTLKTLVEIPSVTKDFQSSELVIKTVHDLLLSVKGLNFKKGENNSFPYLIATTQEPNKSMLWIVSHLDVIPAEDEMFQLTEDENKYFGRGVFDMKGVVAATIVAAQEVGDVSDLNIGFMFTTDEEIGGTNGVQALVDSNFKGSVGLVLDQGADWVIQERMKGVLWLEVKASGKAAHGARPWLGDSATSKLVNFLHEFTTEFEVAIPQKADQNYYTTYNIGVLEGGEAPNQVPDRAKAVIDIRFTGQSDVDKIKKIVDSLTKKYSGVEVNELISAPNVDSDFGNKWFKTFVSCMNQLNIKAGSNGEALGHGSNDGRFLEAKGIAVICTRPPGGGQHGDGEWISKQGLFEMCELIKSMLVKTK